MWEEELTLTELIDVETLQKIQDAFSMMTGIASLTTDINGEAVTVGSNFSDFCMKYTRPTEEGRKRCEKCDKMGAEMAKKEGSSCAYFCHAGLVDFAAPIMAGEKMVGCFIGGQILTATPNEEKMRKVAREIGVDEDEYIEAAHKIHIVKEEVVVRATKSLYVIANVISELAYRRHEVILKNLELEKSNRMKSDFLANMSHEIRTPMNAVIGMAEMALREDMSDNAKEYVSQIKSSGQTLLTIINDILDFSKIESGKMEVIPDNYEPMSVINDMVNIIVTRIGDKDLELIMDVNPDMPQELYGDSNRIKQVMVNLANNAVKFTQQGSVQLSVDFEWIDEGNINLKVDVIDTGMGIKEEDMGKLFKSFQQVDSKRNRNVEGTGLGLAISRQLLGLMDGHISVQSVYGEGSTFSFTVPQKVTKKTPSIPRLKERKVVAGLFQSPYIIYQLEKDLERMGAEYIRIKSEREIQKVIEVGADYFFVEQVLFTDTLQQFLREHPELEGVALISYRSTRQYDIPNLHVVKKPLYALGLAGVFFGEDIYAHYSRVEEEEEFDFIAPDADVLVVDDNAINLTVARGLLEPLQMHIDTALSGKEAVTKMMDKRYDIVFMDHMMPGMDGIETTHVVRRMLGDNGNVPIIALTANAVEGMREMFVKEGMNDFVAKPIEMRVILSKLRQWLPPELLVKQDHVEMKNSSAGLKEESMGEHMITIEGLDVESAMKLLGNEALFWSVLKEYYRVIDRKIAKIEEFMETEQWHEYTIEVHALKSASRQIGALELAKTAENMEAAGNNEDIDAIREITPGMLELYAHYKDILRPYCEDEAADSAQQGSGEQINSDELASEFSDLREAMDNLDMDAMENVIQDMEQYSYTDAQQEYFEKLKYAVDDIDTEKCEQIIEIWEADSEAS
ncbi:MAG: PocR ligand-binding domain-containing protein [Clostridiales bacterium]|nr:PocR ligand-binding domain-containing protein [Clostridiales bacterium]